MTAATGPASQPDHTGPLTLPPHLAGADAGMVMIHLLAMSGHVRSAEIIGRTVSAADGAPMFYYVVATLADGRELGAEVAYFDP